MRSECNSDLFYFPMKKSVFITLFILGLIISSAVTYLMICSGIDWLLAVFYNQHDIFVWMAAPFVLGGMAIPFVIIYVYYIRYKKNTTPFAKTQFFRSLYSFGFSYLTMTVLKVFTNRVDMEPFEPIGNTDISNQFRFGFMNSNSWWESFSEGWPSGHTMIAVGMAIAIHPLLKSKFWKSVNIIYPILVAWSVSTAFHWLSDVLSGAIIGLVVGWFYANRKYTN